MAAFGPLLKVGSMGDALGVYVPAMALQKAVGLARLVLLAYLMSRAPQQYGMWRIGLMVAVLAAPVLAMGAGQGLRRYVSMYEARGQLGAFYRRVRWFGPLLCVATGCVAVACSGLITRGVIVSRSRAAEIDLAYGAQWALCIAALANGVVMAIYQGVVGFIVGLRAYRLVSVVEVAFNVLFAVLAAVVVTVWPTGLALLWAHLAAVGVTLAGAAWALHVLVARSTAHERRTPDSTAPAASDMLGRLVRFGVGAMAATVGLLAAQSVSLYMVNRHAGKGPAGVYGLFAQLAQPIFMVASAAWTVVLTHAARRWEAGQRGEALGDLQTRFKAIATAAMTLAVVVLAAGPLWVPLLPETFGAGLGLLCGLLLLFQSLTHMALMHIIARLHERPYVVAVSAVVGGAVNAALACWWLPWWGLAGAAWAAGVGMYAGGGAVAVGYLLITRTKLELRTYAVLAAPGLFLLGAVAPAWTVAAVWAGVIAIAATTEWLFSADEKARIAGVIGRLTAAVSRRR